MATLQKINPEFLADPAATSKKLRLLFFSCGTEDPRMEGMAKVPQELNSSQDPGRFEELPGRA